MSSEPIVLDRLKQRSDAPGHWRARDLLPPTGLREHLQRQDQKMEDGGLIKARGLGG